MNMVYLLHRSVVEIRQFLGKYYVTDHIAVAYLAVTGLSYGLPVDPDIFRSRDSSFPIVGYQSDRGPACRRHARCRFMMSKYNIINLLKGNIAVQQKEKINNADTKKRYVRIPTVCDSRMIELVEAVSGRYESKICIVNGGHKSDITELSGRDIDVVSSDSPAVEAEGRDADQAINALKQALAVYFAE